MTDKFLIGHAEDKDKVTGVTVILAKEGAVGGVSVRGAAPGTRETDLLKDGNTVEKINAVVLAGGSAFGLDSCSGVAEYLRECGSGFKAGKFTVPIVCGAVLFDLECGEFAYPDKAMGYAAAKSAVSENRLSGNIGAGTGATVGKLMGIASASRGGLGFAAKTLPGGAEVAAIVAVNALGDIYDGFGNIIAGINCGGEAVSSLDILTAGAFRGDSLKGKNTTIGCILTNAVLSKTQANRLAEIAHDGYALAIRPVHTEYDGDAVFVMASGENRYQPRP